MTHNHMINNRVIKIGNASRAATRSMPISPGRSRLQRRQLGAIGMDLMTSPKSAWTNVPPSSDREGTTR